MCRIEVAWFSAIVTSFVCLKLIRLFILCGVSSLIKRGTAIYAESIFSVSPAACVLTTICLGRGSLVLSLFLIEGRCNFFFVTGFSDWVSLCSYLLWLSWIGWKKCLVKEMQKSIQ